MPDIYARYRLYYYVVFDPYGPYILKYTVPPSKFSHIIHPRHRAMAPYRKRTIPYYTVFSPYRTVNTYNTTYGGFPIFPYKIYHTTNISHTRYPITCKAVRVGEMSIHQTRAAGVHKINEKLYLREYHYTAVSVSNGKKMFFFQFVWEDTVGRRRQALAPQIMHPPFFFDPVIYTTR